MLLRNSSFALDKPMYGRCVGKWKFVQYSWKLVVSGFKLCGLNCSTAAVSLVPCKLCTMWLLCNATCQVINSHFQTFSGHFVMLNAKISHYTVHSICTLASTTEGQTHPQLYNSWVLQEFQNLLQFYSINRVQLNYKHVQWHFISHHWSGSACMSQLQSLQRNLEFSIQQ